MSHPSPPASPLGPVKAIGTPSLLPQASFSGWKKLEKSNSEGKKSSKRGRKKVEKKVLKAKINKLIIK